MANVKELNINSTTYDIVGKAVVNQNSATPLKQWSGTKAQYDALVSGGTVDSNTIYNITDDTNPTQALLEAIYPVGSIYIGTMNTCPLAALFGTWTLVAADRVLQGSGTYDAGDTVEAGLPDITSTGLHGFKLNSGTVTGALVYANTTASKFPSLATNNDWSYGNFNIKASNSNAIYGNSTTVQPPAFVVNIWQRTA